MSNKIENGKFGLEIPALTQARIQAEANDYNHESRENYRNVMKEQASLIESVCSFLEKNGSLSVSPCGSANMLDIFGIITSEDDPAAPCGITFYGSGELAQDLANAFPAHKVIASHNGKLIAPTIQTARLKSQKPGPHPKN